ncbi:lactate utilization protein [Anaeroselena agilis]|uniref:Lactate utilization protein n=1 Tax=Anaeroselena agilis TaxID=3063788 RepID=A0ABU3P029_9FIRM|nr:lactate utilization protein [Selenomonadales bacterium 4137-cl]
MQQLLERLKSRNMHGYLARDRAEAKELALGLIPSEAVIAMGNSLTLRETGIFDALTDGRYNVINQFEQGISADENLRRRKQGLLADVYFTSANAVSLDGELFNIDGKGNRVAAMLFGPERVIVVVGRNKLVRDQAQAWQRLREATAPALARRLKRSTPCAVTGTCADCNSPERICRCYTVISSQMPAGKDRIHVIIVNEDLGL